MIPTLKLPSPPTLHELIGKTFLTPSEARPTRLADRAMTIVTPLHAYFSPAHLEHVVAEMKRRGPPRIRAFYDAESDAWLAFEGTHRLRAALRLGIVPVMVPVSWPRSRQALINARFAAQERGHAFPHVDIANFVPIDGGRKKTAMQPGAAVSASG